MPPYIQLHDKEFSIYISHDKISERLKEVAGEIELDFKDEEFMLIGVLNGAFLVTADLCREFKSFVEVDFLKWTSYDGLESTGTITKSIGLKSEVQGKNILIVEDIVDTGNSMNELLNYFKTLQPKSLKVFTLLHKPEALKQAIHLDYIGFSIPNNFVVGYGLDYNGLGRNLKDIYTLKF